MGKYGKMMNHYEPLWTIVFFCVPNSQTNPFLRFFLVKKDSGIFKWLYCHGQNMEYGCIWGMVIPPSFIRVPYTGYINPCQGIDEHCPRGENKPCCDHGSVSDI
jgi:hypothetical protein